MAEKKTVIIRKRSRKTPEVKAFIDARWREKWKQEEAERERELREIEDHLEKHNTYQEILRMLARHIHAAEHPGYYDRYGKMDEQWEIQMELFRLIESGPDFIGGDDVSGNSIVRAIHELASVSANKGRIVGAKLKGREAAKKKHEKHTEPDRALVREWWMKWQDDPCLFKNKAAFDESMYDKTGKKIRTIQEWRKALQNEHTVC